MKFKAKDAPCGIRLNGEETMYWFGPYVANSDP